MDSITEKFSVFDFFNLMIGGMIFLFGIGICKYPQAMMFCKALADLIGESTFLLIIAIILTIGISYVIGTVINEAAYFIFERRYILEKNIIESCLNRNGIIENSDKLKNYRKNAEEYFKICNSSIEQVFTAEQCSTYFAHCVYYLHVRNQDKKIEKLRETEGLAQKPVVI